MIEIKIYDNNYGDEDHPRLKTEWYCPLCSPLANKTSVDNRDAALLYIGAHLNNEHNVYLRQVKIVTL